MKNTIVIGFLILLCGCATNQVPYKYEPPPKGMAKVVLYRPDTAVSLVGYPYIYVDGKKIGTLTNNSYFSYEIPTGKHLMKLSNFWMWDGTQKWNVDATAGNTYFFRVIPVIYPGLEKGVLVEDVSTKTAINELMKLK